MERRTRSNTVRISLALAAAIVGFFLAFLWADSPSHSSIREVRGEGHKSVVIGSAMLGAIAGAGVALLLLGRRRHDL